MLLIRKIPSLFSASHFSKAVTASIFCKRISLAFWPRSSDKAFCTQWRHNTRDWGSIKLYLKEDLELTYLFSIAGSHSRGAFLTIIPLILWMHYLCTSQLTWRKITPFINQAARCNLAKVKDYLFRTLLDKANKTEKAACREWVCPWLMDAEKSF